jgi:hypothetical protein
VACRTTLLYHYPSQGRAYKNQQKGIVQMIEEQFKVVFTGILKPGPDIDQCISLFARQFRVPTEKAQKLIQSGRKVVLKKGVDANTADTYRLALEKLGMEVQVEPMQPEFGGSGLALEPMVESSPRTDSESQAETTEVCPKCGSSRLDKANDTCLDCGAILSKVHAERTAPTTGNPYATPRSELYDEPSAERTTEMTGPHARTIGSGWRWLEGGFSHFKRNFLAWMAATVLWIIAVVLLSLIPVIGVLAVNLVTPVVVAGLMRGCRDQEQGLNFRVAHLFAGFSQKNVGQLLLLGALMIANTLIVDLISRSAIESGSSLIGLLGGLMILGLSLLAGMAFYFAPVLIALEEMPVLSALKSSFSGCAKNILPFLWYFITGFLLLIAAVIPLGLGLLVLIPIFMASPYAAYRDIYYD